MLTLDHLTVIAPTLAAGVDHVRRALGLSMPPGGKHPQMGTHNHLMRLGDGVFLEVIAIDPDAPTPGRPRWFGMDQWGAAPPRLAGWVVRTEDLDAALQLAPSGAGRPLHVSRGDLRWRFAVSDDGAMLFDGAYPSLMQWPAGPHPSTRMSDLGCSLLSFKIEHPQSEQLQQWLAPVFADARVELACSPCVRLTARIATPAGVVELA